MMKHHLLLLAGSIAAGYFLRTTINSLPLIGTATTAAYGIGAKL